MTSEKFTIKPRKYRGETSVISSRFLIKLVGTLTVFDKANLVRYFRGLYLARAKDAISSFLLHKQISVLEINAYLDEISDYLNEKIQPILGEYGINLLNFFVNEISIPEEDASVIQLKNALAKRAEMAPCVRIVVVKENL